LAPKSLSSAPERDDNRRRHAELLVDLGEDRGIGLDQRAAALNAIGRGHPIGKFEKRLGEDALAAVDIDDPLIVAEIRRRGRDGLLGDALCHRLAFELGEPLPVWAAGAARRGSGATDAQRRQADDCGYRAAPPHCRYQLRISSPVQYSTPSNLRL
jgi:hypothetical protein